MAISEFVTVACKAPNGIVLDLDRCEVINAEKGVVRVVKGPAPVRLRGWSRPWGAADHTEGGYALTQVPKDFWDAWWAANSDSPLVADKIILPPHRDARGQAHDHAAVEQMFRPARDGDVRGIKAKEDA